MRVNRKAVLSKPLKHRRRPGTAFGPSRLEVLNTERYFIAQNRAFVKKYGSVLKPVQRFIVANYKKLGKLLPGKLMKDSTTGAVFSREFFGKYPGAANDRTLKVVLGEKAFFVKIGPFDPDSVVTAMQRAQKYLLSVGNRCGEFKVRLLQPHLVFTDMKNTRPGELNEMVGEHTIIVSDFFSRKNAVLLYDLEQAKQPFPKGVKSALSSLERNLSRNGVSEVGTHNAFYDYTNRTIYLFDLEI
jgi:hypothetical protein